MTLPLPLTNLLVPDAIFVSPSLLSRSITILLVARGDPGRGAQTTASVVVLGSEASAVAQSRVGPEALDSLEPSELST